MRCKAPEPLTVTGEDLSAVMDLMDFSGLPYPGMTPDLRVLTILAKYAMFGIVPVVLPVIAPDIEVPIEQDPDSKRDGSGLHPAVGQGGGIRFLHGAGAGAGDEPGLLGSADQDRRTATGLEREHGYLDERGEPEFPLRAASRRSCPSCSSRIRPPRWCCRSRSRRSTRSIRRWAPWCRCPSRSRK